MNLVDELYAIANAFEREGIVHAICGGIAVSVWAEPRATKDIDILIERRDVPRVLELLRDLGYLFVALPMVFDEGRPQERHVQRVTKMDGDEHLVVDLILADAAFADALTQRVRVQLPQGSLSLVSKTTLIQMKRMAGRPQDLADL